MYGGVRSSRSSQTSRHVSGRRAGSGGRAFQVSIEDAQWSMSVASTQPPR